MSSITKLDKPTIRRITSGQVITDLCSVLKELIENALDANSRVITVRLNNFGLNRISVEDDGTGIALGDILTTLNRRKEEKMQECNCNPQNEERASRKAENAHKYTTAWTEVNSSFLTCRVSTKLYHESNSNKDVHDNADGINTNYTGNEKTTYKNDEGDKFTVKSHFDTLGFRGEALYSLASMSYVDVLTMWEDSVPYTVEIRKKDSQHTLEARLTNSLKGKGTTVIITNLFEHFPVRRLDLERNCRKQMSRAVQLLRQYAVSHANVKLNVLHQEYEKAAVQTLISTTGSGDLLRSVTEVYGGVRVAQMHPVQWNLLCGEVDGLITNTCHVERTGSSEQILILNGRAVDLSIITKAINDACSACCSLSCKRSNPSYFLRFNVNDCLEFDVNLTPNKRKVAIVNEDVFAREVYSAALEEFRRNMEKNNLQSGNSSRQEKAKTNNLAALSTLFDHDNAPAPCAVLSRYTFRIDTDIKTREESKSPESCEHESGLPFRLLSPYLYCCDDNNVSSDRFDNNIDKVNDDRSENVNAVEHNGERVHMGSTELAPGNTETTEYRNENTALMQCVVPTKIKEVERDSEYSDELKCKYQRVEYNPSTLEAPIITTTTNDRYLKSCVCEEDRHTENNFSCESQTHYMTYTDPNYIAAEDENQIVINDEVTNCTLTRTEIVVNEHNEQLSSTVLATETITAPAEEETFNMTCERESFMTDEDNVARKAGVYSRLELTKSILNNIITLFCPFEEVISAKCKSHQSLCDRLENTNNKQDGALLNFTTTTSEQNATFSTLISQSEFELSTYFHKRSFNNMRVIGQFNQGFIISLFNQDLFVIDQHASDEKYNFEQLLHSYKAKPQRLVKPVNVQMELFEVELSCAHKGELMEQGFEIDKHSNCETQIIVKSVPVLPYDVIQPSDVMELIEQLSTYGAIVNPLRAVWHSMATKACRSSIMIGTALTPQVMQNIINHLASLVEPWHCPHGRPTMRHLGNIDTLIPK